MHIIRLLAHTLQTSKKALVVDVLVTVKCPRLLLPRFCLFLEMKLNHTSGFDTEHLEKIGEIIFLRSSNPIKMEFIGDWEYGAERGWMKIWRGISGN